MNDRLAAYLAATEPQRRGPSAEARALANRRRVAANLAAIEPTPKPGPKEPLARCIDCGGLVYRRRPCTSPFCA